MNEQAAAAGRRALLTGSAVLALAMIAANAGNYVLNLVLGRLFTPAAFSDANLIVTLFLSMTALAQGLELVTAKAVAEADAIGDHGAADRAVRLLVRWAWIGGIVLGVVVAAPARWWSELFSTASPWPFVVFAVGVPFYLVQSVGRGSLQGRLRFGPLAWSFVVEMLVRLGAALGLVALGAGVTGASAGLALSLVAAWVVVLVVSPRRRVEPGPVDTRSLRATAASVAALLVAQVLVNNSDVLVAKAALSPHDAGIYAAIALVGRAVFFLSWSVATVVFPHVARGRATGTGSGNLVRNGVLVVLGIGVVCAVGALVAGGPVLGAVLGPEYGGLSLALAAYASVTTLFAAATLVASARASAGRTDDARILLAGAGLQIVILLVAHADTVQLIGAQAVAMTVVVLALVCRRLVPGRAPVPSTTGEEAR